MRVLVDTSVWSLALRRRPEQLNAEQARMVASLSELVREGLVEMIGPIRQELLSGLKESAQFERLRKSLQPFLDVVLDTEDFEEAARCYNVCRSKGLEGGPIDILICAVALRRKWLVFTSDDGLKRCAELIGADVFSPGKRRPVARIRT